MIGGRNGRREKWPEEEMAGEKNGRRNGGLGEETGPKQVGKTVLNEEKYKDKPLYSLASVNLVEASVKVVGTGVIIVPIK